MKKKIKDVIQQEFKGLWGTDFADDGIPVIKTNNMTYEGCIDFSDICKRNISFEEASPNFLQKGDLIIEKSGGTKTHSVGYVNIFEGEDNKYICNNFILPLRPNKDLVDCKYLFWQLHGMYEAGRFADCYNKTTGIQNLQKKSYFAKEINVPSIEEQQKIAAELDTIQSAIDNKKQQLSLLDETVKSEFVEMFGEIKETVIIKDVCDVSGGYSFKSNDISDSEGVKILQIGNVAINDISWETTNYLPKSFIEKYNNFSLNENDIVMALTRPIIQSLGNVKTCMIRACDLPCLLNQRVGRIRPKDNTNIHYIFYCFMQHSFTSYIQACCKGSSQPNMSTKDIENFIIPKAPIELQNQFAAFVQQIDKSKFVVKQQIADLQELLDSKMQEYFS